MWSLLTNIFDYLIGLFWRAEYKRLLCDQIKDFKDNIRKNEAEYHELELKLQSKRLLLGRLLASNTDPRTGKLILPPGAQREVLIYRAEIDAIETEKRDLLNEIAQLRGGVTPFEVITRNEISTARLAQLKTLSRRANIIPVNIDNLGKRDDRVRQQHLEVAKASGALVAARQHDAEALTKQTPVDTSSMYAMPSVDELSEQEKEWMEQALIEQNIAAKREHNALLMEEQRAPDVHGAYLSSEYDVYPEGGGSDDSVLLRIDQLVGDR